MKIAEQDLKARVQKLADMEPKGQWTSGKHAGLLTWIAIEHGLPEESKLDFLESISQYGIAGNSSQFSQWAEKQKLGVSRTEQAKKLASEYC